MKVLAKVLVILAAVALSDAHWGVMKAVIWVQMTCDAMAASEPVWESVCATVSGEKKCQRCLKLEQDQQKSRDLDQRYQWEGKTSLASDRQGRTILFPAPLLGVVERMDGPFPPSRNDEPLPFPPWS